ncbi:FecR family protein [Magnetospirillum molischianum]|uniref:Putative FecR n=1 Tax=Magnetospirillum molischianum DSM 120 TaxID=1150626 RepID=H8FSJ8_MAGML|nr:FecR family protein [Magnetospirillum molischianum]CCG41336.1 putative FecR [Magnetospirillum molischianum DSM 120]
MSSTDHSIPDSIFEQASDWLFRIQDADGDEGTKAALQVWLAADPRHQVAWRLACQAWKAVETISPDVAASPRCPRRLRYAALALAACLAAVALLPSLYLRLRSDLVTMAGQSEQVRFDDGSRVVLGGDSAVSHQFSANDRSVSLLRGEAFFEVTPDRTRPFVVRGDGVTVTVTGTAFGVDLGKETTSVAVAQGSVIVGYHGEEIRLVPGQKVAIDLVSGEVRHRPIDPADVAAWRRGRLVVGDQTLSAVVDSIRRHYSGFILLTDSALGGHRVTGIYDLGNPERALRALVSPYGGTVRRLTPYLLMVSAS